MKAEVRAYDGALASYGDFSRLQAVAAVLAGKENAAADAMSLATTGMRVEAGLSELGRLRDLRAERASEQPRSGARAARGRALGGLHIGAPTARCCGCPHAHCRPRSFPLPADLAVEKDILRRQPLLKSAPADDLSRLQERLAAA